jgi:GAF domain-containing protein
MLRSYELNESLLKILDAAMAECGAVKGNVQLFDPHRGGLRIVAQRGFDASFLQLFQFVRADEPSTCGRACRQKQRVVIQDVATDAPFAPYLSIARANGFQSVQSTPILAHNGDVLGVFSTHFAHTNQFSGKMAGPLDRYTARMAALIEEHDSDKFAGAMTVHLLMPA